MGSAGIGRNCSEIPDGWVFSKTMKIMNHKAYIQAAKATAKQSYCKKRQVGCVIVKNNKIITDGRNGSCSGFPNICEDKNGKTLPETLHAESNAIAKMAKAGISTAGAAMYVTTAPCIECAKLIIQCGFSLVVYYEEYKNRYGLDLLDKAGIKTLKH